MDKRIRELVEQAFLTVDGPETFKPSLRQPLIDGLEDLFQEFARLIAKECAVLAMTEHHSTSPADYGEMDPYEQGCDDTASAISGKIRRIFGVE